MYTIDKNIPLPPVTRNGLPQYKYPFFEMNVGDSFAVPVDPTTTLNYKQVSQRVANAILQQRKRPTNGEMNFCYRTDKETKCVRVWRIK
jgi:hypothetical protein